jgi:Acetyltransferase (GNAT) family
MPERARAARLRIREVRSEAESAFRAAFQLLARVFPRSELLPRRAWAQVMRERRQGLWTDLNWHLLVAEYGRRVIGVASGSYLGNLNVGVIGYIAVAPTARSFGIGPRLRLALRLAFERDARRIRRRSLEALVGEVQADNPWLRRLVARRGAIALDFPYYQPSLRGRTDGAVALVLYYQPLHGPRASLPTSVVRRLLYTMWRRMYRVASPLSRPAFRRMLRALAGRDRIGRRGLEAPPVDHRRGSSADVTA